MGDYGNEFEGALGRLRTKFDRAMAEDLVAAGGLLPVTAGETKLGTLDLRLGNQDPLQATAGAENQIEDVGGTQPSASVPFRGHGSIVRNTDGAGDIPHPRARLTVAEALEEIDRLTHSVRCEVQRTALLQAENNQLRTEVEFWEDLGSAYPLAAGVHPAGRRPADAVLDDAHIKDRAYPSFGMDEEIICATHFIGNSLGEIPRADSPIVKGLAEAYRQARKLIVDSTVVARGAADSPTAVDPVYGDHFPDAGKMAREIETRPIKRPPDGPGNPFARRFRGGVAQAFEDE